ncbi:hypothetical protein SCHPADRAFT_948171 [Schizopora paradoxa]|uniref:HMG box domain-containing protein n=1 Tax=Schizopora paradoxa TaxID=27342 RepID=A0A0H2RG96_9AGAM|nr:hypothetical protein SCHPADRAFT_948171 [Schizopora paradoxa]
MIPDSAIISVQPRLPSLACVLEKLSQAAEAWSSSPVTIPSLNSSSAQTSLPQPSHDTSNAQSLSRRSAISPLPLRSPNPFILFRTHLIASAKASGVIAQGDVSKMASSLWADMDDLDKQTWKDKAALAKESLASKRAEHPELCTRKRAKRGSSDRHRRRETANASAYTQPPISRRSSSSTTLPSFAYLLACPPFDSSSSSIGLPPPSRLADELS